MNSDLVNRLLALNRDFYAQFAAAFSETRSSNQAGLDHIVAHISDGEKVLDIGCGNGRLAGRLEQNRRCISYVGVDMTPGLVEIASACCAHFTHVNACFYVADITQAGWEQTLPDAPFDMALALAVLHHIPSFRLRQEVLQSMGRPLRPGGRLLMTNWQFTHTPRLRRKITAWQTLGIDELDVETGDALLDWKRGGCGYRYCHLLTPDEVERLAECSGYQVLTQYEAEDGLNLCSLLSKKNDLRV